MASNRRRFSSPTQDDLPIARGSKLYDATKLSNLYLKQELRKLGVHPYDLHLPEIRLLQQTLQPTEYVTGAVFGHYKQNTGQASGRGALIATDRRVILIDKKLHYSRCQELTYDVVSGVTCTQVDFNGYITLHTRLGDISVHTLNMKGAKGFVHAIEDTIFEPQGKQPAA